VTAAVSADASRSASEELADAMEAFTMEDTAVPTKEITLVAAPEVAAPLPTFAITEATDPAMLSTPIASTELEAEEADDASGAAGIDNGTPIT